MEQSPSCEANRFSGSQEIPRILWNPKRFITVFTTARHLYLSWARSIQSMPSHPTSWRFILILSSYLRLDLPSGLFPSGFPTKTLYKPFLSPHTCYMPCTSHSFPFDHPNKICEKYRSLSSTLCSFLHYRPKYIPQHLILKHPRPTFLPQCEWPSFTPIQNKRQNYSSVYLNLFIAG